MDVAAGSNPYPGLRPFQADETHLFFGRDEQRIELLQRLRRSRFLAIVGTSGSGKSSLVRAGLLPGLHGGFMAGQADRWRVVDLRPGTDAIGNLALALDAPGALRDLPRAEDEPSFTEATLRRSGLGLVEAVREARLSKTEKVLVLVDQFEELFRAIEATDRPQSSDDANVFVKLLLEAAGQGERPIYIVLTMRSDFLGECARFRDLPEAINDGQYLVPRLTRDQRSEAITGPAAVFGVALARTLVNRLLNDVGDNPDQLPILQHALMRTWDRWRGRAADVVAKEIGLADYEAIGGMARALSLHADAVFDGLTAQRSPQEAAQAQAIASKLFKCLAGVGAGGLAVRRLAKLQEIVDVSGAPTAEVAAVIDAFRAPGNSFLMPPAGEPLTPERYIDISHESLIRNWARMKAWVEEEAESARVYERLSSTAVLHAKGQAGLWDQPDLGVALKWRDTQKPNAAWAERYNASFGPAMAFLDASRARADAVADAKARRRRVWAFSIGTVLCLMLTGILSLMRGGLAAAEEVSRQARLAPLVMQRLDTIVRMVRSRSTGETVDTASVCRPSPDDIDATLSMSVALRQRLCGPNHVLDSDESLLIGIYELILAGRWEDASQKPGPGEEPYGEYLVGRLTAMRWPAESAERKALIELRDQRRDAGGTPPSDAQRALVGKLAHPVRHRIGSVLNQPSGELTPNETNLLDVYKYAEASRRASVGATERSLERKQGMDLLERFRRQPNGEVYRQLGLVAMTPESKFVEGVETLVSNLRDYGWLAGVFLPWPLWRARRFFQHRLGKPIQARPHPMRCATATLFDLAIAAGVGALALVLVESAATIFALLLSSTGHFSHVSGAVAGASGLLPALAYLLCRDAIRLRFRRSIGKAMFDLRPLATGVADPGAMPLRALIERNSPWLAVAILVLLFARYGQEDRGGYLPATTSVGYGLLLGAGLAILLLLANVAFGWFKGRATLIDNWSKTRVIDADCAESLAIRP